MTRRPPPTSRRHCLQLLSLAAAALATGGAVGPVQAASKGKTVLTVTGPDGNSSDFDMAALEALPQHSFTTSTPWFPSPRKFTGPLLRDVLAKAKVHGGTTVRAIALNNYKVDIPFEDSRNFKMLVATRLEDKPMPVREKGPLFIIYPFDESTELRSERYYSRSAWQLRTLEVK